MLYIILFIVFGFSVFNGKEKADKIKNTIVAAEIQVKENDVLMLKLIDSIEKLVCLRYTDLKNVICGLPIK